MKFLENKKGVTMISLTITIIVLIIITSVTLINMNDYIKSKKRDRLYSDISNLKTKIDTYYMEYNEIPSLGKYCTKSELETILTNNGVTDIVLDSGDDNDYYVIDLAKLDNLTLSYGIEYSTWSSGTTIQDLYIINAQSHQIYYPKGIEFGDEVYYCYDINTTTISIPNASSAININNINITMVDQESYTVATGGKTNITINLNISSDSEDITQYEYKYAISNNKDNEPNSDTFGDFSVDDTTGDAIIETKKLGAGEYYLWVKLVDPAGNENAKCVNADAPITIQETDIIIEEVSKTNNKAEIAIRYNPNILSNISYSIGGNIEEIKGKTTIISDSEPYETDEDTGIRTYTLADVAAGNYVYVQAIDQNGNNTSSYIFIIEIANLTQKEKIALEANGMEEVEYDDITNENLKDNENIKAVIREIGSTDEVPLPTGSTYVEGKASNGIVIKLKASEFVWVPVPNAIYDGTTTITGGTYTPMARTIGETTDYQGISYSSTQKASLSYGVGTTNYREPSLVTGNDGDDTYAVMDTITGTIIDNGKNSSGKYFYSLAGYTSAEKFGQDMQNEYNNMVTSVNKYKGFYVGRYETGIENGIAVSKNASTNTNVTTADASKTATKYWHGLYKVQRSMSSDSELTSVQSSMIWGSQYDAMMNWMIDTGNIVGSGYDNTKYNTGKITGESTTDVINNVYDLYGCHYEFTLEASNKLFRLARGGIPSNVISPSSRRSERPDNSSSSMGSRITLYINIIQ